MQNKFLKMLNQYLDVALNFLFFVLVYFEHVCSDYRDTLFINSVGPDYCWECNIRRATL